MKTLKQIVALLLGIAALLASIFSLMDVKRNAERNKQAADFATQAILSAQSSALLEPTLDVDASRLELLSTEVRNTELTPVSQTLDVQASIQKIDNKLKNIQEEKDSEKEKEETKAEQQAEAAPAGPNYNDDNDYPNFCGRLHIPAAGVDVALYNNTDQETCNREDSACVFPKAPQDGGSNIVADNEMPGLTSVAIGSTAYVVTSSGEQINYICVDAFDGHNDVTGFDALQKNDGTVVWGTADLIVYTCLSDAYNVRIVCFNRAGGGKAANNPRLKSRACSGKSTL